MLKIKYEIIINEKVQSGTKLNYTYNKREVSLFANSKGINIEYYSTYFNDYNDILEVKNKFYEDLFYQVHLIYLLINSNPLVINKLTISINGATKTYLGNKIPTFYSMIDSELDHSLNKKVINKESLNKLLNIRKTSRDSSYKSFINLLMAKTRKFESEKFLYLWMSLNAFYNYYIDRLSKIKEEHEIKTDDKKQRYLIRIFDLSSKLWIDEDNEIKDKICKNLTYLIMNYPIEKSNEFIKESKSNNSKLVKETKKIILDILNKSKNDKIIKFKSVLEKQNNVYSIYLISVAYYVRCHYFHVEENLPIFVYTLEKDIKVLKHLNCLLEDFIENNIFKIILNDEIDESTLLTAYNKI